MQSVLSSGARCHVYVNGQRYGECISIQYEVSNPFYPVETIDEVVPVELAPTRMRVKGSIECYRVVGSGGLEGMGIAATSDKYARLKYCTIQIRDAATDYALFTAYYCMVDSQRWSWAAKDLARGTFAFTGISVATESASSLL